jgi:hypothetical protein
LFVLLDFPVAAGQVQGHFRHVVHAGVPDVPHRDTSVGIPLLDLQKALSRPHIGRRTDAHIFRADLLQEQ